MTSITEHTRRIEEAQWTAPQRPYHGSSQVLLRQQ